MDRRNQSNLLAGTDMHYHLPSDYKTMHIFWLLCVRGPLMPWPWRRPHHTILPITITNKGAGVGSSSAGAQVPPNSPPAASDGVFIGCEELQMLFF